MATQTAEEQPNSQPTSGWPIGGRTEQLAGFYTRWNPPPLTLWTNHWFHTPSSHTQNPMTNFSLCFCRIIVTQAVTPLISLLENSYYLLIYLCPSLRVLDVSQRVCERVQHLPFAMRQLDVHCWELCTGSVRQPWWLAQIVTDQSFAKPNRAKVWVTTTPGRQNRRS